MCHNGVHFFDIWTCSDAAVFCAFSLVNVLRPTTASTFWTSQLPKVPRPWCVLYIFTWTCASRRMPRTFSTSQLPKVLRAWCVPTLFTSKCASHQNSVHFLIFHLVSWLRTRRFSEPTFRPSGATNHWKTQCLPTSLPFRAPAFSLF